MVIAKLSCELHQNPFVFLSEYCDFVEKITF